ncbi:conserved hypothetical protein [Sphingomonas sp. EC-HK361]|uniref:NUDIX domain-containing protein n=1 Tax=Sphingomonas sp. EC-HK361 TaxID=2038397 RepID=UPI00125BC069|nr:NUDIX domain-containing protein [Sphingomonas sp. EC-HK361]VVT19611.1 conserved hypothetical protein [Sphingomonas sp. EC-HK361]
MATIHRLIATGARMVWRITRPRTLGVRVIVHDGTGRVVLVRHTYSSGWYLPGGGVEKREAAADAAVREIAEETGLAGVTIEGVQGVFHNLREGKDDHVAVFVARATVGAQPVIADRREIAEVAWFAVDTLPHDVSPATSRRIGEWMEGRTGWGKW